MPKTSLLLTCAFFLTVSAAFAEPASRSVDRQPILKPADQPLDPRITKPEKITTSELPPLPEQVMLPAPPVFRIAQRADEVPISKEHWDKAKAALERGLAYLRSTQETSGGWSTPAQAAPTPSGGPPPTGGGTSPPSAGKPEDSAPAPVSVAITALIVKAIAQAQPDADADPAFRRAIRLVLKARGEDGAFAPSSSSMSNYVTSTVVMALASVNRSDFGAELGGAVKWLERNQWDQAEGVDPKQDWFGGAGYGNHGRPDLSNTQTMLDALHDAGVSPEEPSVQRALAFVSRAQNLKQTNKSSWTGNDGGFVYTPANGGESFASDAAGEGRYGEKMPEGQPRSLRSYGSMTYAGFKSLLYAGMDASDVRIRAAFDWVRSHWTFDENPGLKQQGLYYYYHALARALNIAQQTTITDSGGKPHNWREELIDALAKRQRPDGSWLNEADRWMEGDANLVTAYALLALEEALKPGGKAQ